MGSYGSRLNGITTYTLKYGPDPKGEYVANYESLYGGLNIRDLDYLLKPYESPDMQNLNWKDGVLASRDGQAWLSNDAELGIGYTCFEDLSWGYAFFHIGTKIYALDISDATATPTSVATGIPEVRGTFFRFKEYLFYKTNGAYIQIGRNLDNTFAVTDIMANPYVPVTAINCDPATGAGDAYQPVNRLTPAQIRKYNANGTATEYLIVGMPSDGAVSEVKVNGTTMTPTTEYTVTTATDGKKVVFATAPANNAEVEIEFTYPVEGNVASIDSCRYAVVFGGNSNVCVVFGGCSAQPNAYFWSANDSLAMNPGYFPDINYNFTNDNNEEITGFGKQQNMLVIFTRNTIGRATFGTADLDGRTSITMDYVAINSQIGCDLPWTIQLVENNLVFCNTKNGVYFLHDSSAAYENNVECISEKINGTVTRPGMLAQIRAATVDKVCAIDNDRKYLLAIEGTVYEWDYQVSTEKDPSWFRHTNIGAVAFFKSVGLLGHIDDQGRITKFVHVSQDYEEGVPKRYQFPTMWFGSYDRLKNVTRAIFTLRNNIDTDIQVTWQCDYDDFVDRTPLVSTSWSLVPRDLSKRSLLFRRYANVFIRKPGLKHVKHFSILLENSGVGQDMPIVMAQVFYNFQGRDR